MTARGDPQARRRPDHHLLPRRATPRRAPGIELIAHLPSSAPPTRTAQVAVFSGLGRDHAHRAVARQVEDDHAA
ncbi:MAG: hypothetical protein U0325_36550 [Polyangiales bacterium]